MELSLAARWVFPVCQPPIERGVVDIADGRIVAVHDHPRPETIDLGSAAIIPGLVNAHTHLEFSGLETPLGPSAPFADWVRSVVRQRKARREAGRDPIARGLKECRSTGTALVGEISTAPGDWFDGPDDCSDIVIFRELRGLHSDGDAAQLAIAAEHLCEWNGSPRGIVAGLSPHAPYSVHPGLLEQIVDLASQDGCPIAMHLAETREELELLERGRGPLADLLQDFRVWCDGLFAGSVRPIDVLRGLSRAPRALVIHGNYLTREEILYLSGQPQISVVYCPRTHAYFGHRDYPLRALLAAGVNVALGTDSRASNPNLNLWEEVQTAAERHPDVAPEQVLRMATSAGARALGQADVFGVLQPGRPASLAMIAIEPSSETEPWASLLNRSSRVIGAMHRGCWIQHPLSEK